jgi:ankyrin repeat protein
MESHSKGLLEEIHLMSDDEKNRSDVELGLQLSQAVGELADAIRSQIGLEESLGRQSIPAGLAELHEAIAEKSLKKVNALIRNGVDVNALHPSYDLGFPLAHAIEVGDLRIIRAVLEAGANPNVANYLATCIEENNLSLAKLLIAHGADLKGQPTWEKDNEFETNLMRATRLGRYAFVKLLLEAGADPNLHNANVESALFIARMAKEKRLVKLLDQCVSDKERAWVEERFSGAYQERLRLDGQIYKMIHEGEIEQVVKLINSSGRALDTPLDPEHGSILEEALAAYFMAVNATRTKQTIDEQIAGAKPGKPDFTHPSLLRPRQLVETLLDMGAPVDKGGWRLPLSMIAWIEEDDPDLDLGMRIINKAPDIDAILTSTGDTLLMHLVGAYNVTYTRAVLERGANPNASDRYGETVLQKARCPERFYGPNPCIPLLLDAGAKD